MKEMLFSSIIKHVGKMESMNKGKSTNHFILKKKRCDVHYGEKIFAYSHNIP